MTAPADAGRDAAGPTFAGRRRSRRRPARRSRTSSCATNLAPRHDDHPRRSAPGPWPSARTGRSCGSPGAAIKDDVLARLPELLEQLEANVTAAGGIVHWARDAAEANAIVAGIVRDAGATEVVKVKSMATQEIELNEALAAGGDRRLGDRPRGAHRPARARPAVAHPRAGDPSQPVRDPRHLPARDGRRGPAGARRPDRRPARAGRGGPAPPAREVPPRAGRGVRARTSRSPRPAR